MILDERTEFCDATALNTGAAGTYLLGDVIDLGLLFGNTVGDNVNVVESVYLVMQVDTAATSGGSATGNFILASDAQAAIATDGSATVHYQTGAIAVANLTAGKELCRVELPKGTYERYLGILQTTAVAAFTAGKINAFLAVYPPAQRNFPDAIV